MTANLSIREEPVILEVRDDRIILQVKEEPIALLLSGKGPAGADGAVPVSLEKIGAEGLTDTYRMTFSNGSAYTFQLKNGEKGEQGPPGIIAAYVDEEEEGLVIPTEVDNYEGTYNVRPSSETQTLETSGLLMQRDVNVEAIPYQRVANPNGGYTVVIG